MLPALPFYLIGLFPSGKLIAKLYGVRIEKQGSGNVGATNVARIVGKKAGILTLILDILKGVFAVILAEYLFEDPQIVALAGVMTVLGHCLAIPKILKGGKGIATSLGVIATLAPLVGLSALIVFGLVFYRSRIVSLSSIIAAVAAPILTWLIYPEMNLQYLIGLIGLIVIVRHRENLQRLYRGTEGRFVMAK